LKEAQLFMIRARITYGRRNGGGDRVLDLAVGEQYGVTADDAHEILLFALTAAKKPVVFDVEGRAYRIPRPRLRSFAVWDSG
jgi:hypothetical protein